MHGKQPSRDHETLTTDPSWLASLRRDYRAAGGEGEGDGQLGRKLEQGIALWADLDLSGATTLIERADPELGRALADPAGPQLRTAQLQRLIDALCQLSMRDSVTGLFNRRYFEARLVQELSRAHREIEPCSVALVDFDHLKQVNDRFGHAVGDKVLGHLAGLMVRTLRTTDITTRIGGDEFAVVLPNSDARQTLCAMRRLKRCIEHTPLALEQLTLSITISAGIAACMPTAPIPAELLVQQADEALYRAKAAGRNRVEVCGEVPKPDSQLGVSQEEKDGLLG